MKPTEAMWLDELTWGWSKEKRVQGQHQGCQQVVGQVKEEEPVKETMRRLAEWKETSSTWPLSQNNRFRKAHCVRCS